eukprot:TRINITY_DN27565_c0_g2_i1.p1 TRINITY_DN27565_c0_g2~~TRINITY_DN27565_c0_g2_i1.p1  ORF type:complete len:436 (+),score=46.52 TRINITY_DN27565_c0_g2_i1:74-1381(+)
MTVYGSVFDESESSLLLVDALQEGFPILGASAGACQMLGYSESELVGAPCCTLFQGVPFAHRSRGAQKNVNSFLLACGSPGVKTLGDVSLFDLLSRKDGSIFQAQLSFFYGAGTPFQGPHAFCVLSHVSEGLKGSMGSMNTSKARSEATEMSRRLFDLFRSHAYGNIVRCNLWTQDQQSPVDGCRHAFSAFSHRLQEHAMIFENGSIARREPRELNRGCLVLGDEALQPGFRGLEFSVRVDAVTDAFKSWPFLGFTRKKPSISESLYPTHAKCFAASVVIGGDGEAYARDQPEHLKLGFKRPREDELAQFLSEPEIPTQQRKSPTRLHVGDVLTCRYSWDGQLQMELNGSLVMAFDISRPLDEASDYYVMIDVSSSVSAVTPVACEVGKTQVLEKRSREQMICCPTTDTLDSIVMCSDELESCSRCCSSEIGPVD